jgi:hypothetical protein
MVNPASRQQAHTIRTQSGRLMTMDDGRWTMLTPEEDATITAAAQSDTDYPRNGS